MVNQFVLTQDNESARATPQNALQAVTEFGSGGECGKCLTNKIFIGGVGGSHVYEFPSYRCRCCKAG